MTRIALLALVATLACKTTEPATPWLKGNTHVHSSRSADSDTPPAAVAAWYARHGFDFIVMTDHNRITSLPDGPLLVIPGVELTQNVETCVPPPAPGDACLLHVNALFVHRPADIRLAPRADRSRRAMFDDALALARDMGAIAQLNHPNFHWAIDGKLLAELAGDGALLVEVANEAWDNRNAGDATHPSTEQLWDEALTAGAHLWAIASDDAHHYDDAAARKARGEDVFTGDVGWIRVHAARDPAAIEQAIRTGEFYATNGVELERVERGPTAIYAAGDGDFTFRLISDGAVVEQKTGREARFTLGTLTGRYARVDVTDSRGRRAWLQPVYLR